MTESRYALVLIGDLLPGFDPATTWPALAGYFRIDAARLHAEVLARAPIAVKESGDLAALEAMRDGAAALGAAIEIHPADANGSLFVLLDQRPRGPLPQAYVEKQVRSGIWPSNIQVAAVGSADWRSFASAPVLAEVPAPAAAPASKGFEAIAQGFDAAPGTSARLPSGAAVHAGFWRRCAAYLIDGLILAIPSFLVLLVPLLGLLVYFIGRWLYFALMESSASQATLGKRAMGIIVTDGNGRRIGFGQATGRYFGAAISNLILYIGYMLAGWTERKQALHDLMADTCVVFDGVRPGQALPGVRPAMPWYGWLVNSLLLFGVPIAGILAAIALPAYQDYLSRAKVASVAIEAAAWKMEVEEALAGDLPCPVEQRDSENPLVGSIRFAGSAPECSISVTFSSVTELPAALRAGSIQWLRSADGQWDCSSTMNRKFLPVACR